MTRETGLGGGPRQVRGRLQAPGPEEVGHERNYEAKHGCGLESARSSWSRDSGATHGVRLRTSEGNVLRDQALERPAKKGSGYPRNVLGIDLNMGGTGCPGRDGGQRSQVWDGFGRWGQESGVGAAVTLSNTKNSKRRRKAGGKSRE